MRLLEFKRFCREHEAWVWASLIVVPLAVIAVGCLAWPELFWDRYVWKHLGASLVADAEERPGDDYTWASTLTYAYFLAVAVFGIWRTFQHLDIRVGRGLLVALVPWVVLGSMARSLEDAGLFARDGPLIYLFISPLIYIFEGLVIFAFVLAAWWVERRSVARGVDSAMPWALAILVALNVPPAVVHTLYPDQMVAHVPYYVLPALTALFAALLWFHSRRAGRVGMTAQLLAGGSLMVAWAATYLVEWARSGPWEPTARDTHPAEVLVILTIALVCTTITFAAYWALSTRWPKAKAYITPVASLLFMSHYVDGAATFRGLDAWGYGEKHVLPSLHIDLTGTAAVMLVLKFLVVTAVIYLLDVAYREDMDRTPTLAWLVRVAVMVLGLAPGVRDALRIAMGV